METDAAVRVTGLRKAYEDTVAVDGLDLEVHRGEVFSLLGPNGAGKTTTVEVLEGYRNRDSADHQPPPS
jgi:ABC-2 type transport system ATP-binding protein